MRVPWPSSIQPLSKTWKNISCTSGWAFSTSSSKTTLYAAAHGFRQHASFTVADVAGGPFQVETVWASWTRSC